jgi:hypothetical protein
MVKMEIMTKEVSMATSTLVPLEEYLASHYDPDMEYVDGELVERNVGELLHSRLQALIWDAFHRLEEACDVVAFVVCLMEKPLTPGRVLVDPPLVVVEVLSSDYTMSEVVDKCMEYQRRGARHIWIADPKGRVMVWHGMGLEIAGQGGQGSPLAYTYGHTYTYAMPAKTIYVKDADIPLFEQAQEALGDSISSQFAAFLRERVSNLTPAERRVVELINEVARKREVVKQQPGLPAFIDAEYAEAEVNAAKALDSLRAGEIKLAKVFFHAANAYHSGADRNLKESEKLREKLVEVMRGAKE